MRNGKHLIVGALCGITSTLLGISLAKADCSRDWEDAVVQAQATCDEAAQSWLEDDGLPVSVIGGYNGMWEACMRLSVPVGPLPPSVHYDTTDGTFWTYR